MKTNESIGKRLETLRKNTSMSRDAVAEHPHTTISKSTLQAWELGQREPSLTGVLELAKLYGADPKWILFDEETPIEDTKKDSSGEYAHVPFYRAEASAGHGSFLDEHREPTHYLAFRKRWLTAKGFALKDMAGLIARGDSMEPTIQNGAAIIINTSRNEAMDGGIFVVRIGDRLWVKRTQWLTDGGLRLISDNQVYEKMDVSPQDLAGEDIEVIGQVVHTAYDLVR